MIPQVLRELQSAFCVRVDLKGQSGGFVLLDKESSSWKAVDASKYDLLNSGTVNGNVRLGHIPLPPRRDPQEVLAPLRLGRNFSETSNTFVERRVVLNVHTLRPGYQAYKAFIESLIASEGDKSGEAKAPQGDCGVPM